MTAEGTFPKVDGDILYDGDVNMLFPKLIAFKNDSTTFTSGTNYVTIGSYEYLGAGSLGITEFMHVQAAAACNTGHGIVLQVLMSGTAGLNNMDMSPQTPTTAGYTTISNFLTSEAMTASGGNIGSDYIFFLNTRSDNTQESTNIVRSFSITGF